MVPCKVADADRVVANTHNQQTGHPTLPPDPPTSIFIVPLGPRLDLMTSCRPFAALMFMNRAAPRPMTSALGLRVLTDVIATKYQLQAAHLIYFVLSGNGALLLTW